MIDPTSYHIERVSNGYIVTEAAPVRDIAMRHGYSVAVPPPHVFETFEAMVNWLEDALEPHDEPKACL